MRQRRRVHAGAGVGDGDLHVIAGADFHFQGGVCVYSPPSDADCQLAARYHGVASVERKIEYGVLKLVRIGESKQPGPPRQNSKIDTLRQ